MLTCTACGTEFEGHGYHWCHQVCPACLASFWLSRDGVMRRDGYWTPADRIAIRGNVNANGGRYVPTFGSR